MLSFLWGGSAKTENVNQAINLETTAYDPSKDAHRNLIQERIRLFAVKEKELIELDKKYGMAIGVDLLLWASSALNSWMSIAAMIGIAYGATQLSQRTTIKTAFDDALMELFTIYKWSVKAGPAMSNDACVQDLLKRLLPYALDPLELLPWRISETERGQIATSFLQILADSPHKMLILTSSAIVKASDRDESSNPLDLMKKVQANSWGRFYSRVKEEAHLAMYARRFTDNQPALLPIPQLR